LLIIVSTSKIIQVGYTAVETIKSKLRVESIAADSGIEVHAYHTYNGIYHSDEFLKELQAKVQGIKMSGVSAQFRNGASIVWFIPIGRMDCKLPNHMNMEVAYFPNWQPPISSCSQYYPMWSNMNHYPMYQAYFYPNGPNEPDLQGSPNYALQHLQ